MATGQILESVLRGYSAGLGLPGGSDHALVSLAQALGSWKNSRNVCETRCCWIRKSEWGQEERKRFMNRDVLTFLESWTCSCR